jgi:hypothetical protein
VFVRHCAKHWMTIALVCSYWSILRVAAGALISILRDTVPFSELHHHSSAEAATGEEKGLWPLEPLQWQLVFGAKQAHRVHSFPWHLRYTGWGVWQVMPLTKVIFTDDRKSAG